MHSDAILPPQPAIIVPSRKSYHFSSVNFKYVFVYLDDIIMFLKNAEEHLDSLETVLALLQNAGLTIMLKKCFIMPESMEYVGHTVKPEQLSVAL